MPLSAALSQSTPPVQQGVQELLGQALSLALEDDGVAHLAGQAKALAERLNDTAGRVQSCLLLAEHYFAKGEFKDVTETLEPLLEQDLSPADRAQTLLKLTQTHTQQDEVNHILRCGFEVLSYYQEDHDLAAQSALHGCLGQAFLRLYAFHEALEHYQTQFELLKKQGSSLAQVYGSIGWIHGQLEDYPKALRFLEEGVRLARETNDSTGEGSSLGNLGTTYGMMEDYERAFAYFEQAIRLFEAQGDGRNAMIWYGNTAYTHFIVGNTEQARAYYEKALAQVRKTPNRAFEGWLLLNLGQTLLTAEPNRAEALMRRGFAVMQEVGAQEGVPEAHKALAAHFESRGEYAKALEHHKSYADLEIKLLEDINKKRTEALSAKFELGRLQQEREIYRLKNVELAQAVEKLEQLSSKDSLTGLYNRRYLDEHLAQAFATASREHEHLTVLISDIDNFKSVNDRFSHAVGDEVIRVVAKIFADNVWGSDIVARYGGEEYVAVLKNTCLQQARQVAEKLRRKVAAYDWSTLHPELGVTVSIGLCDDVSLGHYEKMLAAADAKLYEAKRSGKNRVQR